MAVRAYEVEVLVEVKIDVENEDDGYEEAYDTVADIMAAHHADALRPRSGQAWHYTMLEGCVADVTKDPT